ncbi:MAG: SidA/IucD/PvdA family monooxygenase [Lautropia sp.]
MVTTDPSPAKDRARSSGPADRPGAASSAGLAALEARLRTDLALLELPKKPWAAPRTADGQPVLPVVIVGAGMAGLTAAAALRFAGIDAPLFDRAPDGFEGPWATTARMETLRSPKTLTGPCLGQPSLTFRAWYEARFGTEAWAALGLIPRLMWMDYLRWYRRVLALDVRNDHNVLQVVPGADAAAPVRLVIAGPDGERTVLARRVVIATGRDGLGAAWLPPYAAAIPPALRAHSSDLLDFAKLRGLRVGVVGAGASAMDVAATALEAGAASVDLLIRRPDLPRINKVKGAGNPGFVHGYHRLPDDWKWRIRRYLARIQTPPPRGSTLRVSRHPNARFHLGCTIEQVTIEPVTVEPVTVSAGDRAAPLQVATNRGRFALDFLFFSTGFQLDWARRPEFASFAGAVLAWRDRFTPPPGEADQEMLDSPYLGPGFEFQEKLPGAAPGLSRIHCFCYPATLSHGTVTGDIPAISEGAERLAVALAAHLYCEDAAAHFAAIQAYDDPELLGDEWTPAPGPPG